MGWLFQFYIFQFLFFTTITALQRLHILAVEDRLHRFIVGDAHRVGALHDVGQLLRQGHLTLLLHLVVLNDCQSDVGAYHSQFANLSLREELT